MPASREQQNTASSSPELYVPYRTGAFTELICVTPWYGLSGTSMRDLDDGLPTLAAETVVSNEHTPARECAPGRKLFRDYTSENGSTVNSKYEETHNCAVY